MRNNKLAVLGIAALTLTLVTGCAKPPQQEIDGLKADLSAAETAEAPKYAADAWNAAQQAMNEVTAELEAQQNKFALFRSYTKTKELVTAADQKANEAKDAAVAGKEQAKNDADAALTAAQASLDEATKLMGELGSCRRQPKDFKKDMEAMKGNLDGLSAQVAGIQSAIASEDYFGAKSQADSLKSSADGLVTDMQNAKAKIHC